MSTLKIALAQHPPVWMNKHATLEKVVGLIQEAAIAQAQLVVFGETFVPGYPFWLSWTNGSHFDDPQQKRWFAHYLSQAVDVAAGELQPAQKAAKAAGIAVYIGIAEKAADRGGHSIYCTLVHINAEGEICSVHRKLQPTFEERLVWSPGDGHGLRVHELGEFKVGGLNCWENWMPLARTALLGLGENLHIAVWPGNRSSTEDITRFIAKESRSFVVSVSPPMRSEWADPSMPDLDAMLKSAPDTWADGGSCAAAPTGKWVLEPQSGVGLHFVEVSIDVVRQERQNFDPTGHYSRPDVTELHINRNRQAAVRYSDSPESNGNLT